MTKAQRYKVGFFSDEWGMSSITPCLIPDDSGFAVKFEDYCKLETELAEKDAEVEKLKRLNSSYSSLTKAQEGQLTALRNRLYELRGADKTLDSEREANAILTEQLAVLKTENATAWAQAHRLALELECLLLDTKDNAIVSKWWDSGMEALDEYQQLKPGAKEDAGAWAKMRKERL